MRQQRERETAEKDSREEKILMFFLQYYPEQHQYVLVVADFCAAVRQQCVVHVVGVVE